LKELIEVLGIFIIGSFPLKFGSMKLFLYRRSFVLKKIVLGFVIGKAFDDYFIIFIFGKFG
jgi:hypothetical protein